MIYIKLFLLLCIYLLSVEGFAQGQISRNSTTRSALKIKNSISAKTTTNLTDKKKNKNEYVDLGLPSGTLWAETNESGFYDYASAKNKYEGNLPSKDQWMELKDFCIWTWNGDGYKVVGKEGKFIVLPTAGFRSCGGNILRVETHGYYWSSTFDGLDSVFGLYFSSFGVGICSDVQCYGYSVRLVLNK